MSEINTSHNLKSGKAGKIKPGKTTAFFICVLVAAFLWLVKSLNTTYTHTIKIPIEFKNLPQNKKPVYSIPENLNVAIKASGLKLFFILLNQPFNKLVVDFNNLKTVNRNYVITPLSVDFKSCLKFEANIKQINPDTLYFIETNGFQKNIPVKALVKIKCERGFGYKTPEIQPSIITITGDSAAINNIDTIYTQTIILNNLNESVEKKLDVLKPNDQVYLQSNYVSLNIKVEKLIDHSLVLPVTILNKPVSAKSAHVFPARVKILSFLFLQVLYSISLSLKQFCAEFNLSSSALISCIF